ncbi:MAG: HyaD/HybD family hydrogenase maturation endopeptidase [Ignavibacteriaceae bacterium]
MEKLILGIGNTLNHDEGLGVHALEFLKKEFSDRSDIEIEDGGTLGLNLLPVVEGCSHLLILDTIDANKDAGALIEMQGKDIPMFKEVKMSDHQTTFQEVLGFAKIRGKLPKHLFLLGIQPADTTLGVGLSKMVEDTMPALANRAIEIVNNWK